MNFADFDSSSACFVTSPSATVDPIPPDRSLSSSRLLGFAFAGADLLVESTLDGTITFAAGTFRPYFGQEATDFQGRDVGGLVVPADRHIIEIAILTLPRRGRIAPVALRLSNPAHTPAVVAAILLAGTEPRICFTFGPVPLCTQDTANLPVDASGSLRQRLHFQAAATTRLGGASRMDSAGTLGLFEISGLPLARQLLSTDEQRSLTDGIEAVLLSASGPDTVAGELADGRYGMLSQSDLDLQRIEQRIETLIHASPARRYARVASADLPMERGGLEPAQALRALRFAVTSFAAEGTLATERGRHASLAGMLRQAELRARSLRQAIADRRFRLVFQPIVCLADRRLNHYEALLRPIPTPQCHVHKPQDFVAFAEAVGLAEELDWAVLRQALATLRAAPTARVAVNVSGMSMQSSNFRDRLLGLIEARIELLGHGRLLIELTETAEVEDVTEAGTTMTKLRALGVPVCIDDFGAGAAAFRYLRDFRVDLVKIDGGYVRNATRGERERNFIGSLAGLVSATGAKVVAEMIETEENAQLMQSLGVQYGQGYLFGRPGALPGMIG
jgi:EAL domain-containing protein (putative c-di-GMP-specific phosphodiesterase class I)